MGAADSGVGGRDSGARVHAGHADLRPEEPEGALPADPRHCPHLVGHPEHHPRLHQRRLVDLASHRDGRPRRPLPLLLLPRLVPGTDLGRRLLLPRGSLWRPAARLRLCDQPQRDAGAPATSPTPSWSRGSPAASTTSSSTTCSRRSRAPTSTSSRSGSRSSARTTSCRTRWLASGRATESFSSALARLPPMSMARWRSKLRPLAYLNLVR